jgi:hypothetical protein
MDTRGATILASAVVSEATAEMPADILERLARRVDEDRFYSRAGIRTHAIIADEAPIGGYRAAAAPRALHIVALRSSSFEDVRFQLDGRELRWEVRFPKERLLAVCLWWAFVVLPFGIAFVVGAIASPSQVPWAVVAGAVVVCSLIAWFFTAWFIRDQRASIRTEMRRILGEETTRC